MKRLFLLPLILVTIFGCAKQVTAPLLQTNEKFDPDMPVFVAVAKDGQYNHITYHGTGKEVSVMIMNAIKGHAQEVELADEYLKKTEALKAATASGSRYMFFPELVHFEDRNTPWSGRRDRTTLQIDIYDVMTKEKITSTTITANNRWFQFRDHSPMVLLRRPVKLHINSLY